MYIKIKLELQAVFQIFKKIKVKFFSIKSIVHKQKMLYTSLAALG